jgi:drug/metabolite transporter (DMT)-like permease
MPAERITLKKRKIAPVAGLMLLSLLWALDALRPDLMPESVSNRDSPHKFGIEALTLAAFSLVAAAASLARRTPWPRGWATGACVAVGLGLFVAPAALVGLSRGWIADFTRVAVFSLVPVFAVVLEPHIRPDAETRNNRSLIAALAAVGGTLCIFPLELPQSLEAGFALGVLVVATGCVAASNCWAVRIADETAGRSIAPFAALASGSAAIGLAVTGVLAEHRAWELWHSAPELVWAALVDLPGLALLFWLMRRMTATRMTTRFLIAPLIANVAGLILLRARVNLRDGLGLALIAMGAGWLLFADEDEPETSGSSS